MRFDFATREAQTIFTDSAIAANLIGLSALFKIPGSQNIFVAPSQLGGAINLSSILNFSILVCDPSCKTCTKSFDATTCTECSKPNFVISDLKTVGSCVCAAGGSAANTNCPMCLNRSTAGIRSKLAARNTIIDKEKGLVHLVMNRNLANFTGTIGVNSLINGVLSAKPGITPLFLNGSRSVVSLNVGELKESESIQIEPTNMIKTPSGLIELET